MLDLAHELRTPLMAMRATLEAMIDGALPTDREHLCTVHASVLHLCHLVDLQYSLSRMERGDIKLDLKHFDMGEMIEELAQLFAPLAQESGLTLSHVFEEGLRVSGDPGLLRQAVSNLLSNAIRFTMPGGHILVMARKAGQLLEVVVEDSGVGIKPEDLERVFVTYWRSTDISLDASNSPLPLNEGLGIGLAIVKGVAELHGGSVSVESTPGEGARFCLRVPLDEDF